MTVTHRVHYGPLHAKQLHAEYVNIPHKKKIHKKCPHKNVHKKIPEMRCLPKKNLNSEHCTPLSKFCGFVATFVRKLLEKYYFKQILV